MPLHELSRLDFSRRLLARDPSLWPGDPKAIRNRLGWLGLPEALPAMLEGLKGFRNELAAAGLSRVLVLGMGGSSLFARVCGAGVLDTVSPGAVSRLGNAEGSLIVVASKSGTTTEVMALYRHFAGVIRDPSRFVAVTDPGTPLETLARKEGFRRVFLSPPDVGGRYSALSVFGLLPAALAGTVDGWNESVTREWLTPGMALGAWLAESALAGRDKLTLLLPPGTEDFGNWIEQLVAESLGKDGKGLLPVLGESAGPWWKPDRAFLAYGDMEAPAGAFRLPAFGFHRLPEECLRWEVAVAAAAALIGVNPFDEPDVASSKDMTRRILAGDLKPTGPTASMEMLLTPSRPGGYLAILAFLDPTPETDAALAALRKVLRRRLEVPVTLAYGPRYLHSTGQCHKAGPADQGRFLLLTADPLQDLPVPGEGFTLGGLLKAQALGDLAALEPRGRKASLLALPPDAAAGILDLARRLG